VVIDEGVIDSRRFPGRWNIDGWPGRESGSGAAVGLRPVSPVPANLLAHQTALRRGAAILAQPIPHRCVLTGGPSLLDAVGIMRRQPGVLGPDRQRLVKRQVGTGEA
jgi:hypothetical protein